MKTAQLQQVRHLSRLVTLWFILVLTGLLLCFEMIDVADAYPNLATDEIYYNGGALKFEVLLSDSDYTNQFYLQTSSGQFYLGTNLNTGFIVELANPAIVGLKAGDEFVLAIRVLNTGDYFLSGSAIYNPDQIDHALITYSGAQTAVFEFEDLLGGGDRDFNDARIRVLGNIGLAQIPEPASLLLFGLAIVVIWFTSPRLRGDY
jgi:hypothetical protein